MHRKLWDLPPGNMADGYEEATSEACYSREYGRETEGLLGEGNDEPDEQSSPDLVESNVDQSYLQELNQIPLENINQLRERGVQTGKWRQEYVRKFEQ